MSNSALIIVDIQNDYFEGGLWTVPNMPAAAKNAARLLARARDTGQMVVHIRHEFPDETAPFFRPGSKGAEIHASVAPQDGEPVLTKGEANSFLGTGLLDLLKNKAIDSVTICGAMSQMCIDATSRAAADFGFKVTVAEDACGARHVEYNGETIAAPMVHAAFMGALAQGYAEVLTTDACLAAG